MASGHVNRANRPNTWLHRPRLQCEDSPCQLGAVHTWHKAGPNCPPMTQSGSPASNFSGRHKNSTDVVRCRPGSRIQSKPLLWRPQMAAVPRRLKRIEVYCPEYETTATIRINDARSSGTDHLEVDYRSP